MQKTNKLLSLIVMALFAVTQLSANQFLLVVPTHNEWLRQKNHFNGSIFRLPKIKGVFTTLNEENSPTAERSLIERDGLKSTVIVDASTSTETHFIEVPEVEEGKSYEKGDFVVIHNTETPTAYVYMVTENLVFEKENDEVKLKLRLVHDSVCIINDDETDLSEVAALLLRAKTLKINESAMPVSQLRENLKVLESLNATTDAAASSRRG